MMKKNIIALSILLLLLFSGCSENKVNSTYTEKSDIDISIIVPSDDNLDEALVEKVENSLRCLGTVLPLKNVKIGINVDESREDVKDLICFSEEEINDISFYEELTYRISDLPFWKAVGLAKYVFNIEPKYSENEVKAFVEKPESKELLTMFELYFCEDFSDKIEIDIIKDCAYYITIFTLENYSALDFIQGDYREEWIISKGISRKYRYDEIDQKVQNAKIKKERDKYVITCGENVWEIEQISWLNTADEIYSLIYNAEKGIIDFASQVANHSKKYNDSNIKKSVRIYVLEPTEKSRGGNGTIYLTTPRLFLHEYIHNTLIGTASEMWINEGIAEYYSLQYENDIYCWDDYDYQIFDLGILPEDYKNECEEKGILEYVEKEIEFYSKLIEKDEKKTNQYICACLAEGMTDLYYFGTEIGEKSSTNTIENTDIIGIKNKRLGNELTYHAAMIIVYSLIEEYGVDKVISFSGSFEDTFGITSDEYVSQYIENKRYLEILDKEWYGDY